MGAIRDVDSQLTSRLRQFCTAAGQARRHAGRLFGRIVPGEDDPLRIPNPLPLQPDY